MINRQDLATLDFCRNVPLEITSQFIALADEIHVEPGQYIVEQFYPADVFFFLVSGSIQLFIKMDEGEDDLLVGSMDRAWTPIGWSGFPAPHRYATSVRSDNACILLRWQRTDLVQLFSANQHFGMVFYQYLLENAAELLRHTCDCCGQTTEMGGHPVAAGPGRAAYAANRRVDGMKQTLQNSLFFDTFPKKHLKRLSNVAVRRDFTRNQYLFRQGERVDGMYLLATGSVTTYHGDPGQYLQAMNDRPVYSRVRTRSGQVVAWSSATAGRLHSESAVASSDVTVYVIEYSTINSYASSCPEFGMLFMNRLIWLISIYLRAARVRLIKQQFSEESIAIRSLLQQCTPYLDISSPLFALPHLLNDRLTQAEAFSSLDRIQEQGNPMEKAIAGVCQELLEDARREAFFYQGLQQVYASVVRAPPQLDVLETRRCCDIAFRDAFNHVRYVIDGLENLPESPGHIFILNHLVCHPYYTLANNFALSLDTQFVSAMILFEKYGDGGVRVVRRPRGDEIGHQEYYDRLGHIYVETAESRRNESGASNRSQWQRFLEQASDHLHAGRNLVICPEGTSNHAEDSPSAFRSGAFRLAAAVSAQPYIVPIAVANFDKRLKEATLGVVIKKPFRMQDAVDVEDREQTHDFLCDLRRSYRGYIDEAADAACRYG